MSLAVRTRDQLLQDYAGSSEIARKMRNLIWSVIGDGAVPALALDFVNNFAQIFDPTGQLSYTGPVTGLVTTERASAATYFDASGVMQLAGNDVLRFDHDPATGEPLGVLIEEPRTNLALHSGDLMDDVYVIPPNSADAGATKQATSVLAPDGVGTFTRIVEGALPGTYILTQSLSSTDVPINTEGWYSVFVKAAERTRCVVQHNVFSNWETRTVAVVDLTNGEIIFVGGVGSPAARVQDLGDGVYRVSIYGVTNEGTGQRQFSVGPRLDNATDGTSYTGDGTSGILAWGYQVELGPIPTSYIPTEVSQVTRAADDVRTSTDRWLSETGTFVVDIGLLDYWRDPNNAANSRRHLFTLRDSTATNRLYVYYMPRASGDFRFGLVTWSDSGIETRDFPDGLVPSDAPAKVAFTVESSGRTRVSINGGVPIFRNDVFVNMDAMTQILLGTQFNPGSRTLNSHMERFSFIPRAVSDAELQDLSS